MIMIITHHVIVHGLGLRGIGRPLFRVDDYTYYELGINSFVVIAVNVFIFISGYFGIKLKLRTIFSLVFQAIFYSTALYLLFTLINPAQWSIGGFANAFLPISRNMWWFISTYICLCFISPFLNRGIEALERKQLRIAIAGVLFINCFSGFMYGTISGNGYTIFNFVTIYLVGRYIRKYGITIRRPFMLLAIFTLVLLGISLVLLQVNKPREISHLFLYNNPLVIASSVMLFFGFKNIVIKSNRFINAVAGSVLGVYMLHEYSSIRYLLVGLVAKAKGAYGDSPLQFALAIELLVLSVFAAGTIVELTRKRMAELLSDKMAAGLRLNGRARRWKAAVSRWGSKLP
jgi:hypothetical protein